MPDYFVQVDRLAKQAVIITEFVIIFMSMLILIYGDGRKPK